MLEIANATGNRFHTSKNKGLDFWVCQMTESQNEVNVGKLEKEIKQIKTLNEIEGNGVSSFSKNLRFFLYHGDYVAFFSR
jgi:hypothetical protein